MTRPITRKPKLTDAESVARWEASRSRKARRENIGHRYPERVKLRPLGISAFELNRTAALSVKAIQKMVYALEEHLPKAIEYWKKAIIETEKKILAMAGVIEKKSLTK
jgi:hypothetical protein